MTFGIRRWLVVLGSVAWSVLALQANASSEEEVRKLFQENRPYATVPQALFDQTAAQLINLQV